MAVKKEIFMDAINKNNIKYFIFVSPHHDDVAFSLSGIIQSLSKIKNVKLILVNIFSISDHIKCEELIKNTISNENILNFATQVRKKEDATFCRKYRISYCNLDLEETGLFCNPFDSVSETREVGYSKGVEKFIKSLKFYHKKNKYRDIVLLCPLAIGKHRDHVITFNFISKIFRNHDKSNIVFYEDSPYMSSENRKKKRFTEIGAFLNGNCFKSFNFYLSQDDITNKEEDIKMYKSQLNSFEDVYMRKYCNFENNLYYETIWIANNNLSNLLLNILKPKLVLKDINHAYLLP